jgi:ATP-dependent Clp protease, protease subunit
MPKQIFNTKLEHGYIKVVFNDDAGGPQPVEMMIYEDIGDDPWSGASGITAKAVRSALADVPKGSPIDLRINSNGGDVREGKGIKTAFDEWTGKKTASIDGMAASVASWLPMNFDEIRAPAHAEMFIHDAWGMVMGNAEDLRKQADELDQNSHQIAQMYAKRTGSSVKKMRDMMKEGTLMTAEKAKELGFIDRITDDKPVANFRPVQISNMRNRLAALNKLTTAPQGGQPANITNKMTRKEKIALLNRWGVSVSDKAPDAFINGQLNMIKSGLVQNAAKFKNGKDGDHADDCDCADCSMMKNAPEPDAEEPDADHKGAPGDEGKLFKAATENSKRIAHLEKQLAERVANERKRTIQNRLENLVTAGKVAGNEIPSWMNLAIADEEKDGVNTVLDLLDKREPTVPGRNALTIELGESDDANTVPGLEKIISNLRKPADYYSRNGTRPENMHQRMVIGQNSKQIAKLIGRMKAFDKAGNLTGPLRDSWDRFEMGGVRNANTMTAGLLRQVILSEVMRAFRRAFQPLTYFAHNFGNIPLEGTDVVQVPYYPLDTVASQEFSYANGYLINPQAQTLSKNITVGGIGNGAAPAANQTPGRKYKTLQFTAYEIRRQPWLDIQKLSVMAGEQLAQDVRADVIGTQINAANFGPAVWTGAAGGFTHDIIVTVLMATANANFWPKQGRNVVANVNYHANLANDPVYAQLYSSGDPAVMEQGVIKNKAGFENICEDAILPINQYIQSGTGAVTAGSDPYLAGYMCWPSAVLVATAPIMPSPGVLKKLVAYEQITDDQTDLTFTYRFWGSELNDWDNEVIECAYGSSLGELKALNRFTSQGA